MTDADDRGIEPPGIDAWFEQVLDGEAPPADAPGRYGDLAILVCSARAPGQADELRDEDEIVRRMSDVRAAVHRRAGSRAAGRRSAAPAETAETAGHPAVRTVGRVVALKAAAVATATVIGVTAAAATTGLVATVVVPALTEQAPVDRPTRATTGSPEPGERQEPRAPSPRRQDSDRGVGATGTCSSLPAPCDTARSRATTTTRTTDDGTAGASTSDETPASEVPGSGMPAPGSTTSEPPAEAPEAADVAPPVQPGTLSAPDDPGPGHSGSAPPSPPAQPAQPPGPAPGPASPPAQAPPPDRPGPSSHAPTPGPASPPAHAPTPGRPGPPPHAPAAGDQRPASPPSPGPAPHAPGRPSSPRP